MLGKVKRFAVDHDVHVWFVAHPVKMQPQNGKMPVPTLYDISGSANWTNKADVGLVVHRNFDTNQAEIHVQKVRDKWAASPAGSPSITIRRPGAIPGNHRASYREPLSGRLTDEGRSGNGGEKKSLKARH
jgi:hypothetical protein